MSNGPCISFAVKVLGDKWSPRLLFALAGGPLRFCELQERAGGVNPRTLSQRLDDLEQWGVVSKKTFNEAPPRVEYTLTKKGEELMPILRSMAAWGEKHFNDR